MQIYHGGFMEISELKILKPNHSMDFTQRPQVTQKNVYLFIPNKVAKICRELNRTETLSLNDSILKFYNSPVYETLSRESSKLWQEGWVYVYQMMK